MTRTKGRITVGLDVGGAHLKAARLDNGHLIDVRQVPCPLWQGIDRLDDAVSAAAGIINGASLYAITMTAELTEIFATRRYGVAAIAGRMSGLLMGDLLFYMGLKGFGGAERARSDPDSAGSANFLASAQLIASRREKTLLIDMGSTTTDIIACDRPQGLNDAERLQTGELVYTGLTRTPVASVATRAPFAGQWQSLARDGFARMADVRRVLGNLHDDVDQHQTADGRGKSAGESLARFARGFGHDAGVRNLDAWRATAAYIREAQLRSIHNGALQVLSRPGAEAALVIGAGIGASECDEIARRLGLPFVEFGTLIDADEHCRASATQCAPAVAVALLAQA